MLAIRYPTRSVPLSLSICYLFTGIGLDPDPGVCMKARFKSSSRLSPGSRKTSEYPGVFPTMSDVEVGEKSQGTPCDAY